VCTAAIIASAKSPLLSACAILPSLDCKRVGSSPNAASSRKPISDSVRGTNPPSAPAQKRYTCEQNPTRSTTESQSAGLIRQAKYLHDTTTRSCVHRMFPVMFGWQRCVHARMRTAASSAPGAKAHGRERFVGGALGRGGETMPSFDQTPDKPKAFGFKVLWFAVKAAPIPRQYSTLSSSAVQRRPTGPPVLRLRMVTGGATMPGSSRRQRSAAGSWSWVCHCRIPQSKLTTISEKDLT